MDFGWTPMVVAVIAAIASVGAAVIARRGSRDSGLSVAELQAEARARALVERYQEPMIRAAYDLQSRLYNILERGLLQSPEADREYVEKSTLWLLGQYFGWQEIMRRETQFLHLPDAADRQQVQILLGRVARACSSDTLGGGPALRIQRSEQRAMGEVMTVEGQDAEGRQRSDCLGYAAFSVAIDDSHTDVYRWYHGRREQVWQAGSGSAVRLRNLQHALIELVHQIDAAKVRFPEHRDRARTSS